MWKIIDILIFEINNKHNSGQPLEDCMFENIDDIALAIYSRAFGKLTDSEAEYVDMKIREDTRWRIIAICFLHVFSPTASPATSKPA